MFVEVAHTGAKWGNVLFHVQTWSQFAEVTTNLCNTEVAKVLQVNNMKPGSCKLSSGQWKTKRATKPKGAPPRMVVCLYFPLFALLTTLCPVVSVLFFRVSPHWRLWNPEWSIVWHLQAWLTSPNLCKADMIFLCFSVKYNSLSFFCIWVKK